jgi:hypothetical protein
MYRHRPHRPIIALGLSLAMAFPPHAQGDSFDKQQAEAFRHLGFVYLDYPAKPEDLALCIKTIDKTCINAYRVLIDTLFCEGRSIALKRAFQGVSELCATPQPDPNNPSSTTWTPCRGAVSSFYFFSSDAEDRSIIAFMGHLPTQTLKNIFLQSEAYAGDWIHNRPNRETWLEFFDRLPFLDENGRAGYNVKSC